LTVLLNSFSTSIVRIQDSLSPHSCRDSKLPSSCSYAHTAKVPIGAQGQHISYDTSSASLDMIA
jgi:hypothetical protein